ncbi:thiamine pyrophosphate-dependent enzyme [Actinomadura sp. B10D3]|uniref:alpha-ketoacid dehydrogenase subunit alpha/beta n=1 Tax=Actinomadura sp. B10D3 TaxID=3153557 RepID=UPI00325E31A7
MPDADPRGFLTDMYRQVSTIRRFEERILELSKDGEVAGSVHVCLGQEAVPAGVMAALRDADRVLPTYRGHGWALACGVPVVPLLAEICHRGDGVNGGRGGSAYLSSPAHRLVGENSIVGAGVPIASGVALAAKQKGTSGIAVASIGDGAMSQGSVHEGMVFAAANKLPLVIMCENNGWAEMTPASLTSLTPDLADRAAGYGIPARIVDGSDPQAVFEAAGEAAERARSGGGPTLIECKTGRLSGHYNRDIQHYRPQEDIQAAAGRDPMKLLRSRLRELGVTQADIDQIDRDVASAIDDATRQVLAMPVPEPANATTHVYAAPAARPRPPAVEDRGAATELTYQRAVNTALQDELEARPEVVVYGEDVGTAGGIFGVSRSLQKKYGQDRVFDTPIAESAILGSAVGAAISGLRPVAEIMWMDFLWVAFDQLVNQASNVRYISRGELSAPLVVRTQQGSTPGSCAQHSQSLEALIAHIPGLRVGLPSSPADAYAMTRAAIADPDPTVLIECRELYQNTGDVYRSASVESAAYARLRRSGRDLTIITWGAMVDRALSAAGTLSASGVDAGVLDLRWLNPLDDEAISAAVRQGGGHVLVAHEANVTGGFGAEISARITERHFADLAGPVMRVGAPDTRLPSAPALREAVVPGEATIVDAARRLLSGERVSALPA